MLLCLHPVQLRLQSECTQHLCVPMACSGLKKSNILHCTILLYGYIKVRIQPSCSWQTCNCLIISNAVQDILYKFKMLIQRSGLVLVEARKREQLVHFALT